MVSLRSAFPKQFNLSRSQLRLRLRLRVNNLNRSMWASEFTGLMSRTNVLEPVLHFPVKHNFSLTAIIHVSNLQMSWQCVPRSNFIGFVLFIQVAPSYDQNQMSGSPQHAMLGYFSPTYRYWVMISDFTWRRKHHAKLHFRKLVWGENSQFYMKISGLDGKFCKR